MAFPVTGIKGNITCATASTDLLHLLGNSATTGSIRVMEATLRVSASEHDITGF